MARKGEHSGGRSVDEYLDLSQGGSVRTALDSSVILDVITDDPSWGHASEKSLCEASALGQLVIGECVLAEIVPALGENDVRSFLRMEDLF